MAPSPSTLDRTAVIVGTGSSGGLADGGPDFRTAPEHRLFRKAVRGSRRTRIPSRREFWDRKEVFIPQWRNQ
jgi:hypothetical protein